MAQHLLIFSTICFMSLVFLGGASGNGNTHAEENSHNYSMPRDEERTRRDLAEQVDQRPTAGVAVPNGNEGMEENKSENNNFQTNFGNPLQQLNIVKRAPSGFTGMRGKKEHEFTDFSNNAIDWSAMDSTEQSEDSNEDYNDGWGKPNGRRFKKAPTAFYGVRGKKYTGNDYSRLDEFLHKLEEERLREALLEDFLSRLTASTVNQNEISKRAPTGFTGMRGKRPAPALTADFYDTDMDKRAPVNAFVGVRGKKDVDHQNFKRSPSNSFNTGLGGSKRQRFVDFTNKFVAVRGKKNSAVDDSSSAEISDEQRRREEVINPARQRYFVNMLPSLLYGSSGKRTPSGFQGMRGKREAVAASSYADADLSNTLRSTQ